MNLLSSTIHSSLSTVVIVRYLAAMSGILILAWPLSDIVGRQIPPQAFSILAHCQVVAIPFLVNSFITNRFELQDRIPVDDWISYTPISPLSVTLAHAIWALFLSVLLCIASLPLMVTALPLAGQTWITLVRVIGVTLAISLVASTASFIIVITLSADWLTSAIADACIGMWILMTIEGIQNAVVVAGKPTFDSVLQLTSPFMALNSSLLRTQGFPWEPAVHVIISCVFIMSGAALGLAVRYIGRSGIDARGDN